MSIILQGRVEELTKGMYIWMLKEEIYFKKYGGGLWKIK